METNDTGSKETEDFKTVDNLKSSSLNRENVSEEYVPEGFDSQDEFLADMREKYEADINYDKENRDAAVQDKMFAAGDQWDPVVLEYRKGLPTLTINSVPQFTAQIVGDWREARNAIKVLPSEDGDVEIASVRGDLIRAIEAQSRASRVYDSGFESMIQCGDGAWRVSVEYANEDVFDQDIHIRPVDDALSAVWDHLSIDPTGRDATHVFLDDRLPRKEFKKNWKDADPSELSSSMRAEMMSNGWCDEDSVRVTEYWRMIERKRLLTMFEDGSIHFIQEDTDLEEMVDKHGLPVKTRVAPCRYAQMHLVTGFKILEGPYEYKLNRVPIIRCTGRVVNINGKRTRYGLVRFMKDPVRLRNFWRSIAAEQLGYAPKAKWIAQESSVEGREDDFRKAHLNRDPLLIYNDDTEEPKQVQPPAIESALLNEAATNAQDMKDVTGIHDASLGVTSNETSGRAIQARQREGDIASLTYHDNGNASILETGDVINQLISQVYDGTRIVRVIGEDQEAKLVKINDPMDPSTPDLSVGKYDVAMTTGSSYTTRRVEAAAAMIESVQAWPQMMEIAGDLVAKAQDWPGAQELAERLKKAIPPQLLEDADKNPIPPEVQQQMQEMEQAIMMLQEENKKLSEGKEIEHEETRIKAYEAETKRLGLAADQEGKLEQIVAKAIMDALNSPDITSPQESQPSNPEG